MAGSSGDFEFTGNRQVDMPQQSSVRSPAFWVGSLAIFMAGLSASLRSAVATDIKSGYLDPVDLAQSGRMIGVALGAAFLGFSITLMVSSLMLDRIGMKRMLLAASAFFLIGTAVVVFGGDFTSGRSVYHVIIAGMFICGIGWGCVEGTVNPLVASLYPNNTTHWMNMLHAWWPMGVIVGGLTGVGAARLGVDWRVILSLVAVFALLLGILTWRLEFPPTTSVKMKIGSKSQFLEIFTRPSFFIWFALMLCTAATELAPGQWVDVALTNVVGMRGVLLLVYVSAIMFVGRHFAGPLAHRLSPEGLLAGSSALAFVGLYGLSVANSPLTAMLAATSWGLGVCYLWPTMIAVAAERYPKGGALAIGLMGVAGSISSYAVLPALGAVYDSARVEAAGGAERLATLTSEELQQVLVFAAGESFRTVSLIPAFLVIAFTTLWFVGYRSRNAATTSAPS
jgi:fucose permease